MKIKIPKCPMCGNKIEKKYILRIQCKEGKKIETVRDSVYCSKVCLKKARIIGGLLV